MKLLWERQAEVPVGRVWKRFTGRATSDQPARQYQIRDMDEQYQQICLQLLQETLLRDEPLSKFLDFKSDPESISSISAMWLACMRQRVSLACFTEEDGRPTELVAFNVNYVKTKHDCFGQAKGEAWSKISKILDKAESLVDTYSYFGVDKYLSSCGLTVLPGHRGQNIACRMFEAREPLCQALNIPATCTVFTAVASQVLAKKSGYQLLATLPYSAMLEQGMDLRGCETDRAEVRGIKFNF